MYQVEDLIVYGSTGVCKIVDITAPNFSSSTKDQLYYVLKPLHQDTTIYAPMDNPKVSMRSVISKSEAKRLIDSIPSIQAEAYHNNSTQQLTEHYNTLSKGNNCADLIEMAMSIYAKKKIAQEKKHKLGQVDERFMKHAEEMLHCEFSVALGIPREEVAEYINNKIETMTAN